MPTRYVVEMLMDRIAASKIYEKEKYTDASPLTYYEKGKIGALIHPETRVMLERFLHMLAEMGEDKTFAYIKKEILKKK